MAINNNRGAGLDEVLKRLYGDGMDVSLPEARCNPWNGHRLNCPCEECQRESKWYAQAAEQQRVQARQKRAGRLPVPVWKYEPEQISWEERAIADVLTAAPPLEASMPVHTDPLSALCTCRYCTKLRSEEVARASEAPAVVESVIEVSCPTCRRDFGSFRLKAVGVDATAFVEITPVCQGCAAEGR